MTKHRKVITIAELIIIALASICLVRSFKGEVSVGELRGIPYEAKQTQWSIGIYLGEAPFNFISPENVSNPVLTAKEVTDVPAAFVADPFMIRKNSTWYMFFEVMNTQTRQGDIGLAISNDGLNWVYRQIVLDEPFHLSYPYIVKWRNEHYMVPESCQANSIRLYKTIDFPTKWSLVGTLLYGNYVDPSVFHYKGRWWMFVETNPEGNDILRLYYADELIGPWIEHPKSPIIEGDANIARPGGRVLVFEGRIIRYTQDDDPTYGNQVRAFEITELTTSSYEEKEISESPILKAEGTGWTADGMHHIDPHQIHRDKWIACVDGCRQED